MSHVVFSVAKHFKSLTDNPRKCIAQFSFGTVVFLFGMLVILMGNYTMSPSLAQEIAVFAGITVSAIGFLLFISAHICLMISRFKHF